MSWFFNPCKSYLIFFFLKAGHCVRTGKTEDYIVEFGRWTVDKLKDCSHEYDYDSDCMNPFTIPVKKIIRHPNFKFNLNIVSNDIALLKVSWSFSYKREIKPICLPTKDETGPTVIELVGFGKFFLLNFVI